MEWQIEKGTRCDLLCYAAKNLTGKFSPVRVFPGGNRKGDVKTSELRSIVVRAHFGTRVILVTEPGPDWQDHAWRCVRIREGTALLGSGAGALPGARIPDLDLLDNHGDKRTNIELESSYPIAATLEEGEGWTFGRLGELKGKVKLIRIEKDRLREASALAEADRVARAVLERLHRRDPAAMKEAIADVCDALQQVLVDAGHADANARVREVKQWAGTL